MPYQGPPQGIYDDSRPKYRQTSYLPPPYVVPDPPIAAPSWSSAPNDFNGANAVPFQPYQELDETKLYHPQGYPQPYRPPPQPYQPDRTIPNGASGTDATVREDGTENTFNLDQREFEYLAKSRQSMYGASSQWPQDASVGQHFHPGPDSQP